MSTARTARKERTQLVVNAQDNSLPAATLRDLLETLGISVPEFARSVEASESAVRGWLRGESQPNLRYVRRIVRQYGIKPSRFFDPPVEGVER